MCFARLLIRSICSIFFDVILLAHIPFLVSEILSGKTPEETEGIRLYNKTDSPRSSRRHMHLMERDLFDFSKEMDEGPPCEARKGFSISSSRIRFFSCSIFIVIGQLGLSRVVSFLILKALSTFPSLWLKAFKSSMIPVWLFSRATFWSRILVWTFNIPWIHLSVSFMVLRIF